MSITPLKPLAISEILDGAFTLYRRHFLLFFGTHAVILAPAIPASVVLESWTGLVSLPLGILGVGTGIWQISEAAQGRRPDFASALRMGFRRFFPVLGVLLVSFLIIFLGIVLFIVPGIIFGIMLIFVTQVAVLEGKAFGSLDRSKELAGGAWTKIFIVYSIATLIVFLPGAALNVGMWFAIPGANPLNPDYRVQPLVVALDVLVSSLTSPFAIGATTLLYYDQRVRKEGLDIELEAAAIDASPDAAGPELPPAAS